MPNSNHPDYDKHLPEWQTMLDAYQGERAIKAAGMAYLPPTSGMVVDGVLHGREPGRSAYAAYLLRALYPDHVRQAVHSAVGIMHRKPAVIEVPTKLEPILERASNHGESIWTLHRRINERQLLTGRCVLLADVVDGAPANVLPHLALYDAPKLMNWNTRATAGGQELVMAVLDESGPVLTGELTWNEAKRYRIIRLDGDTYKTGIVEGAPTIAGELIAPSIGGRSMKKVPLVIVNAGHIGAEVEQPPLLPLAHLALAVYRGEADYRQALFMQAQPTLVRIGHRGSSLDEGEQLRLGAGGLVDLPLGGDLRYAEVSGAGLAEMRQALENDRQRASEMGAQLLQQHGADAESAEALRIRMAASTATLTEIAETGAEGLKRALQHLAVWAEADPEEVVVEPNLDFADDAAPPVELEALMRAKMQNAPLSMRSIHTWCRERELTSKTFEEELDEMQLEFAEFGTGGTGTIDIDPLGPRFPTNEE